MNESFFVNNKQLSGAIISPEVLKDKNPAILFIHGLTGHKESNLQYANCLAKLGYISFIFDLRGHGESEEDINIMTANNFMDDVLHAYDYFISKESVDKNNISVVGTSMGSYLATRLSSKRDVKNLVIRAPADYPNEVADEPVMDHGGDNPDTMTWRKRIKKYNGSFALESMHSFNGNVLVIESENDDLVPHETVENYITAAPDKTKLTYVLIKNTPHSIKEGKFRDEVEKILVSWFKER